MNDLISRQAAIDAISCNITVTGRQNAELVAATIGSFADRIKALPPVQPKRGKWEYHSNPTVGINPEDAYCSCCGFHVDTTGNIEFDEYNFCPNCGADMRGEAK